MRHLDSSPARLRKYRSRILVIMGALLMLLVFLAFKWPDYLRQMESVRWPTAPGVIISSELKSVYVRAQGAQGEAGHYADVQYRYTVGGVALTGIHFSFDQSLRPEEIARSEVDAFPVGKTVAVYYSPENPGVAVLVPGLQGEERHLLYLGIGLTSVFTLLVFILADVVSRLNRGLRMSVSGT